MDEPRAVSVESRAASSRPQVGRVVAAVVMLVVALVVVTVMAAAAWGLSGEFASVDMLILGAMPWALVPAALVAGAVALLNRSDARRRAPWIAAVAVWVSVVVIMTALALWAEARAVDTTADGPQTVASVVVPVESLARALP